MMKKKFLCTMLSASLIATMLLSGCSFGGTGLKESAKEDDLKASDFYPSDDSLSDSEKFEMFSDELFKHDIVENIINLHYTIAYPENYGIDDYEVIVGSYDKDDYAQTSEELKDLQETLEKFNREELTREQRIAYDILDNHVKLESECSDELFYYGDVFSAVNGLQTQIPPLFAEYTFRREKDVQDYLEMLSQLDETFSEYMVYEQEKTKQGLGQPDFAIDTVIEACDEFVKNPDECYLIETFNERIDALQEISDEDKKEYKAKNEELIKNDVMNAYKKLAKSMKALKGKGKNENGLFYYDYGKEYYEYLLRSSVGTDWDVDDLKKTVEKYMDDCFSDVYGIIQEDPGVYYMLMAEEPLSKGTPEEIMEELIEKSEKDFGKLENVNYKIKFVPKAMEEHSNPAFYLTPPMDDTENNVIYINHKYDDVEDMFPLLAHEGYPGHLYQIVSSLGYDRPLVRRLFSYGGYTEGFATYAEMYSYELVDDNKNYAQILKCDNGLNLALASYIDICVNYYGWTEDDVCSYFEKSGYSVDSAKSVFEMVVEEPAEYLKYFVGYLEFVRLRDKAQNELGNAFDIKEFHEFLVGMGTAPFYIIEDYMDEWIKEQK